MTALAPVPRTPVLGTARYGDPFLESDAAKAVLASLTVRLWSLSIGQAARGWARQYDRMQAPEAGDLAVVTDHVHGYFYARRTHPPVDDRRATLLRQGVGYFLLARVEWDHTDRAWSTEDTHGEWCADSGDHPALGCPERPSEPVFYVQYGPAPVDVCRWFNASAYAVPGDPYDPQWRDQ